MKTIRLKPGREKSLARRHPWVFSGAIDRVEGDPGSGETVAVRSGEGRFLAWAAFSPSSQIRARVWSFDEPDRIDAAFFCDRIARALARRGGLPLARGARHAGRLVHGESDGLPGLVADHYADTLVVQCLSAGPERWRDTLVDLLLEQAGCTRAYERSDADVRALEGLPERTGLLRGDQPEALVEILETGGARYLVDVRLGQKTGFYLDQRDNRALVASLASGGDLLNCFCYTGGFTVAALARGARFALSIDSSAPALALAQRNAALNGIEASRAEWREADVFKALRELRDAARSFDVVVLDPPKFAPTAGHVEKAARAYKDINLLGLKLVRPGGTLATFSCSGGVSADLFQKIVAGAAADAGVDAQVMARVQAAADHPVMLAFPEGEYLKGLVLRRA